ncbi:type II toxin-antitoxin system HicB family antitoxin [Pseudobacillus badius]|uniref:type II toxin-antitoxin system HicB family antitoxin n=1 Tax=Bacillus badius TaxID=1455 RepID=UPI0024A2DFBD|nr:type II toxin-antitoxin system HicB family antitoxin [Bacillus badius]GLY12503.1 hypothetical protein Bbad01_37190 [Bacillus badius]
MTMYKYYAVIEKDLEELKESSRECFTVSFPDLENVFTDGETLPQAVELAHDVLGSMLAVMEEKGRDIPAPSKAENIELPEGASLVLIEVDTKEFNEEV